MDFCLLMIVLFEIITNKLPFMQNKTLFVIVLIEAYHAKDCIVYITHYSCLICTRLLLAAGVSEIRYIEDYKNDDLVQYFASQKKVNITK